MTSTKSKLLAGSLFTSIVLAASAASAQTPGERQPGPPPGQPPAATAVDELIVTGSRIRRNEYTSEAPLTVVTSESATLQGLVDTAQLLQTQPIASGSGQTNNMLTGFVVNGGPGVQTVSLRGLGDQRTLVLLDGRRLGPAGVRGTVGPVDLNVIPQSIIERIEILKDGASSIYGSDAVAGVVNFITKKRLDEGMLSIYASQPFDNGGEEYKVYGSWGKTFDRGFISASADYTRTNPLALRDRDFTACAEDRAYDPQTFQRLDHIDPLTNAPKCYNVLTNAAIAAVTYGGIFQYSVPGITYPGAAQGNNIATIMPGPAALGFVRAARAGQPATFPYANYDSPWYGRTTAISPSDRFTFFVNGGFNLTPGIELYGDLLLNRRESEQRAFQQIFPTVAGNNPNNPFIDNTGARIPMLPVIAVKSDGAQEVNYYRAVGGARGKLPDLPVVSGWDWDIFAQYSKSDAKYQVDYVPLDRLEAVTAFSTACNQAWITENPATCPAGGIPFFSRRVLGGTFTPEEADFLFEVAHGTTEYTQVALEGSITGDIMQLPAGPLSVAVGFHIRRDEIDDTPDEQEQIGNLYNQTAAGRTAGKDTVKELFAELSAPVFRGTRVGDFDMTVSGRLTDYDSYGSNSTYKLGFNWQVIPAFRIRGTHGTSYRAPALYELFLADQTGFLSQTAIDPCIRYENSSNQTLRTNCAASGVPEGYAGGGSGATIFTGGGIGRLEAETSKASTFGVILTPDFSTFDFSIALDYFDIEINEEVRRFGARNIITQCLLREFPNGPFCELFERDPTTDAILTVQNNFMNVANQVNRGLDLNMRYQQEFGFGTLTVDTEATWQFEDVTQLLGESEPEDFNGSTTESDFTAQVEARLQRGDWTAYVAVDIISKASDSDQEAFQFTDVHPSNVYGVGRPVYYKQFTEFQTYTHISVRKIQDKWTFWAGIRNLFDDDPPALSGNEGFRIGYGAIGPFDFRGRRAFIQIDRTF
ncbi:TonB-dependent receptor domain-containing protein [Phenylobacterium sp.]|jgi:iron complex outermembrane receptor protein|uniref:TonB-dependent receptor domain-containing protein n=1 Tax=Phenylobacterium sp. TaxID=1871053 RepID=UPI002F9436BF